MNAWEYVLIAISELFQIQGEYLPIHQYECLLLGNSGNKAQDCVILHVRNG